MRIAVVGVGKLGLCFALHAWDKGFDVVAVDKREDYIEKLRAGEFRSNEPVVNDLLRIAGDVEWTTDMKRVAGCELVFVFVATPSLDNGEYDHSAIEEVLADLPVNGGDAVDLVISCTTMPGYCASAAPAALRKGYRLHYNPEFIAQGEVLRGLSSPDAVLIGADCIPDRLRTFYHGFLSAPETTPVFVLTLTEAELAKVALNCFLTMKIAYANAIGDLAYRFGCNPKAVLEFIGADSRIGRKCLSYGDGYGGPCLPRDNVALQRAAQAKGMELPLCEAADEANLEHLHEQFRRIRDSGVSDVELDGVAYKKGTDILEESQRLALALLLRNADIAVTIRDSESVIEQLKEMHGDIFEYEVTE